jgi:predicted CXXCH cytochrome family protein
MLPSKIWIIFAVGIIGLGLCFWGCVAPTPEPAVENGISPEYAVEIQPLKPHECGRCHQHFQVIRTKGGKHRIDCQLCHVKFHIYRPGKVQYKDIMPKCSACHDLVHGPDLSHCSECHSNAHTPLNIPAGRALEQGCHVCHPELDKEMKTYITQHTELYCFSCHHTRHKYVPECMECHQPHTKGMTQAECLTCHPPHKALQVVYPKDTSDEACAGCHRIAYEMLEQSGTRHRAVRCTKCHPDEHRAIMRCRDCHPQIHSRAAKLNRLPVCGRCHGVAHSLRQ